MHKIILVGLITFLFGCKPILFKLKGIKTKVHYLSEDDVKKYAIKHQFDTSNLLFNNVEILRELRKADKSPNIFLLFNTSGNLLIDTMSGSCKGLRERNFKQVLLSKSYHLDSTLNFFELRDILLNRNPSKEILTENYNYFVILSWATYAGQLNKGNYKKLLEEISQNEELKIKIITINMDFIEGQEYFQQKSKIKLKS
ncbi:MAG: hypothetical protein JNM95_09985 [Chitinophagaceae bacterium]|nr:hypothetical protein [Chitinophagaceae bacterium]